MPSAEWTFSLYIYFREKVYLQAFAIRLPHVCVNKSVTYSTRFGEIQSLGGLGSLQVKGQNTPQKRSAEWGDHGYGRHFLTDEQASCSEGCHPHFACFDTNARLFLVSSGLASTGQQGQCTAELSGAVVENGRSQHFSQLVPRLGRDGGHPET